MFDDVLIDANLMRKKDTMDETYLLNTSILLRDFLLLMRRGHLIRHITKGLFDVESLLVICLRKHIEREHLLL
jgi:hypothetical protein